MYYAIVFLPLLGFLIAGLFSRSIGAKACEYITTSFLVISALLSWIAFFHVAMSHADNSHTINMITWINSGGLNVNWALKIDTLTVVMLVVVNTVSALVHIYSIGYMHHDPHRPRFFAYISLFTFAMLMLVTSDNLLQMFFGWEGVGLASYLLIGFWFKKPAANAAAMKAFIINRIGDFGFALGIFGVYVLFDSIDFNTIFANLNSFSGVAGGEEAMNFLGFSLDRSSAITVVCLLLFMGAMGKSAQFLLHTWLPDAMEGPTPVSALIHAATMVTAGVFLIARMSPLFELSMTAMTVITIIGATTAFFAATVALVQNDIKRVIAYSTCSQLGYMFAALGVGAYGSAVFHLLTHACFKALLFLCAGSVIHAMSDEQDMRKMGGLKQYLPHTYWTMVIATLAITGFGIPGTVIGLSGFFSKDAIIESTFVGQNIASQYAFYMTVIAALLTSFYSWRLIFMTFHGKTRASADAISHIHESPLVMRLPLYFLAFGSIFAGLLLQNYFVGGHSSPGHIDPHYIDFWKNSLAFGEPVKHVLENFHEIPLWAKFSPSIMMALGFVIAYWFYMKAPHVPRTLAKQHHGLYKFLLNKWYFDELYDFIFVRPLKWLGHQLWVKGCLMIIDGFGPDGVAKLVQKISARTVKLQTGYVYHYAFAMLIGVAALITWMMFGGVSS